MLSAASWGLEISPGSLGKGQLVPQWSDFILERGESLAGIPGSRSFLMGLQLENWLY